MSVRFLHTADWQIGMRGTGLGSAGTLVAEERLAALDRIFALATERDVQLVLACGDLFENNQVDEAVIDRVAAAIRRAPQVEVHAIPGNHDLFGPASVWRREALTTVPNLHIHTTAAELRLAGLTLHPLPVSSKHQTRDPLASLPDLHDRVDVQVALAHGHLTTETFGLHESEVKLPLDPREVDRIGLDYLALGHWHGTRYFSDANGVRRIVYSGTHEQTKFEETGAGSVLLVEIAGRGAPPRIEELRTGGLRWAALTVDFDVDVDLSRLDRILDACDADLLRLDLQGEMPHYLQAALEDRLESERDRRRHLRVCRDALRYVVSDDGAPLEIDDESLLRAEAKLLALLDAATDDSLVRDARRAAHLLFRRLVREESST